jgi:hypothetical protein
MEKESWDTIKKPTRMKQNPSDTLNTYTRLDRTRREMTTPSSAAALLSAHPLNDLQK